MSASEGNGTEPSNDNEDSDEVIGVVEAAVISDHSCAL